MQQVFEVVRGAQNAALDAAREGRLSGRWMTLLAVSSPTRVMAPTISSSRHRLGHGIGLDGHEHPYLVGAAPLCLDPGMTFSNEPGIYIPGEFGIRCEDDMVISASGPAQLLTPGFQVSLRSPSASAVRLSVATELNVGTALFFPYFAISLFHCFFLAKFRNSLLPPKTAPLLPTSK